MLKSNLLIKINNGEPLWETDRFIYLLAMNVSSVPNHIALVFNGKYYDLGFKKKNVGADFLEILSKLKRKNIPTLVFECRIPINLDIHSMLQAVFSVKNNINSSDHTCLNPVNEVFEKIYSKKINSNVIFDLVESLFATNAITNTFSLHLNLDFEGTFHWNKYSYSDLKMYLENQLSVKHA